MSISFYGLIAVTIAIAYSFRRVTGGPSMPRLDRVGTSHLKGLAILLVLVSHLANLKLVTLPNEFKFSGAWGVAIFLLLSGYGLTQSYLKDGITPNFLNRRFSKVMLPYMLVTGLWVFIDMAVRGVTHSFDTVILSLFGLDFGYTFDPTMWFVTFIALWYVIFYLAFKLPVHDVIKIGLLFGLAFIFRDYAMSTSGSRVIWQWNLHAYAFPIGVLIGLAYRRVSFVISSNVLVSLVALAGAISFFIFGRYVDHSLVLIDYYSRTNIAFAFVALSGAILLRYYGLESRALAFFGAISYEIYLLEWALMARYDLPHMFGNMYVGLVMFFAALVVLSMALSYVLTLISNRADEYLNPAFAKRAFYGCRAYILNFFEATRMPKEELPAFDDLGGEIVNR